MAQAIDRHAMLAPGQRVVLAVSGGRDSMVMLAAMAALSSQPERAYGLSVAHLDHQLRPESAQDSAFVEQWARRHSLPCVVEAIDVRLWADQRRLSIETAARQARYEFLAAAAEKLNCAAIATAHHRDDQVETVLHRLLRGSHLRGLAGMPATRRLPGGPVLIRPMLDCPRAIIDEYARQHDIPWRDDPSNAQTHFTRNAIRNDLLPYLAERFNPNVAEAILRLATAAQESDTYLTGIAAGMLGDVALASTDDSMTLNIAALAEAEPVLQKYVLRLAVESLGTPMRKISAAHLATLAGMLTPTGPAAMELPSGLRAQRDRDGLHLTRGADEPVVSAAWPIAVPRTGHTPTPTGLLTTTEQAFDVGAFEAYRQRNNTHEQWLDAAAVAGELYVRPWHAGDRFRPLGAPGSLNVSDMLTNLKLPPARRRQVLCLCDAEGIVCLLPVRLADRAKVTPRTEKIIRVELRL